MKQIALQELLIKQCAHDDILDRGHVDHFLINIDDIEDQLDFRVRQIEIDRIGLYSVAYLHFTDCNGQFSDRALV